MSSRLSRATISPSPTRGAYGDAEFTRPWAAINGLTCAWRRTLGVLLVFGETSSRRLAVSGAPGCRGSSLSSRVERRRTAWSRSWISLLEPEA